MWWIGGPMLWIGEKATFKSFKRMGDEYIKRGVYECGTDIRGTYPLSLYALSVAIIVFSFFIGGFKVMMITFMITLFVSMTVAIVMWLYGPSARLERGRLIIKYKDKEVGRDIANITAKFKLANASKLSDLHITTGREASLNEKLVFRAPYDEGAAFACLINFLKDNELEKLDNLTLDEFSEIYNKCKMPGLFTR